MPRELRPPSGRTLTSQFPPPTTLAPPIPCSPKVNMLSSPFWMTTNTSIHVFDFARFPVDSQYCLRHSIPSFAHGGPRSASSSSVILISVEESSLCKLCSSSSRCSRMMVWERFDAKPMAGARKDNVEPPMPCEVEGENWRSNPYPVYAHRSK